MLRNLNKTDILESKTNANQKLFAVIGLGNPGLKYSSTRHNIGFRVIDRLAAKWNATSEDRFCFSLVHNADLNGHKIILAKPQLYMNRSGKAVKALIEWYKVPPQDLIIVYDDIDLKIGKVRLRRKGSDGGHRGVQSVINNIQTSDFPRLKIGIGRGEEDLDVIEYVLDEFTPEEDKIMEIKIEEGANAVEMALKEGIETAMNVFN